MKLHPASVAGDEPNQVNFSTMRAREIAKFSASLINPHLRSARYLRGI
jgi:hypothetical protein